MVGKIVRRVIGLLGLIGLLLSAPLPATAHPLDEYYQVTIITVSPNRVTLALELYPAVLIAPQLLSLMDADQDEQFTEAEQRAYLDLFQKEVRFEVDGQPQPLTRTSASFPGYLDIRSGGGVIKFELVADLPADHRGDHQLFYENHHLSDIAVYVVQPQTDLPDWVQILDFERDVLQQSIRVNYAIDPAAPVDYGASAALTPIEVPGGTTTGQARLSRYLYDPNLSPLWLPVVLGVSLLLGGLHALTPGHGKTLVAAYLIGSRGTVKHAVLLGGIVTFTHTASVILIGLLALLASQFIVPTVLGPALEISSGLLVLFLGARLLAGRWRALKRTGADKQAFEADNSPPSRFASPRRGERDAASPLAGRVLSVSKEGIEGGRAAPTQSTPADSHPHHHPLPDQVKLSDLLTLGISGGLVPCPEALGVMLIAVGLNRILLGLGMIVAFSLGLAAILIVIGVLLVRSRALLDRFGQVGGRWQTVLPLVSAVIVTLLGLGIVVKGVWPLWLG